MPTSSPLRIERQTEELTAKIEVLDQKEIVEEEAAKEMLNRLEQMKNDACGTDPLRTWEAMDHLNQTLKQTSQEAAEEAMRSAESLAETEAMSDAISQNAGEWSPEKLASAMNTLAGLCEKAMDRNALLKQALDPKLLEACRKGQLSPEQLKALTQACRQCRGDLSGILKALAEAGLIDPSAWKACENGMPCSGEDLAAFLKENSGSGADAKNLESGIPGRGGVNRGRADATMTWKHPSSEGGVEFKPQTLPTSRFLDAEHTALAGLSETAPVRETGEATSSPAGLAAGGSGAAARHPVQPRHQEAVKRYFHRDPKRTTEN